MKTLLHIEHLFNHNLKYKLDSKDGNVKVAVGKVIMKEFLGVDCIHCIKHLQKIYKLLKSKHVLNVNKLDSIDTSNPACLFVFLLLVGHDVWLSSGDKCFSAVVCVLQALKVHYDVTVFII